MRLDPWTVRAIVGAVIVGWLASLVASIFSSFEPPDTLNALFLAVAGSALAVHGAEKPKPIEEEKKTHDHEA